MNRKRILFLGMIMVLCMFISTAFAESWICSNCGTTNSGNFCSNCGQAAPATGEASTIKNIMFSPQDDGSTIIIWDDSASTSEYLITYTTDFWDTVYYINPVQTASVLKYLIPGVTYQITISNGTSESTESYTVPRPIFTEFTPYDKYMELTKTDFSLTELEENPTMTFEIRISWPLLKYSRDYTAKFVLDTPFGYCSKVLLYESFTFENKYTYTYGIYSLQSDFLEQVEEDFGSVPTGEYTLEIYMDGQLYGYEAFTLSD